MMNRIKTGIISLAVALGATVMVIMPTSQPEEVHADPTGVVALNSAICTSLGVAFGGLDTLIAATSCGALDSQPSMQTYVGCLRSKDVPKVLDPEDGSDLDLINLGYPNPIPRDGVRDCFEGVDFDDETNGLLRPTPADFAALDLDANQLHLGQNLRVIVFVDDDAPVRFKTDVGSFFGVGGLSGTSIICNSPAWDADCDGDESTAGDGVVVGNLAVDADVEPGTYTAFAIQEGIGWPFDFNVVGVPTDIVLEPLFGKSTIGIGGTAPTPGTVLNPNDPVPDDGEWDTIPGPAGPPTDCNFEASVDGVLGAVNHPNKMVMVAKALDEDGNEVVGVLLSWDVFWGGDVDLMDDPNNPGTQIPNTGTFESDIANAALPLTPTLDTGALGIGFPQFICSSTDTGTQSFTVGFDPAGENLDPFADFGETTDTEVTVIGEPANISLAVDPPTLACDGTASAAVTATVTTADGDPVANGTDVTWSVQVLGTVSPLSGDTADGKATANVVPFAQQNTGVPVIARVGDLVASTLVQCGAGSAPPVPGATPPGGGTAPGGGAPGGTVRPPDTGNGGDLDGRAALNVWGAVALFAGAMGLIGARLAIRRID
jgi:hypothetical protein